MTPQLAPHLIPQLTPLLFDVTFDEPSKLWALLAIPLLVAAYIYATRRKNRRGMRFTNTSVLGVVVPKQSQWRRHVAVVLSLLSLITLAMAWAVPSAETEVKRNRATIVLVVDVSLSMQATDVEPNRLDAAKEEAKAFAESVDPKFNIAVVSMAGSTSILSPPTTDRNATNAAIDSLKLQESTAIGEGIVAGLRALEQAPTADDGSVAPGAIVLLSDGESTSGRAPAQGAAEAKQAEVPVHTIGYGTENGYVDLDGKREPVPVDHQTLQEIADATGGQYFQAASPEELKDVYNDIRDETGYEKVKQPVTAQFAGYGLAFAVVAALGAVSLAARWP